MAENRKDKLKIDHILSGLIHDGKFRCAIAVVTDTVREAQKRHNTDPLATIALGRALAAAALVGSNLKEQFEYVSLSFLGNGPLRHVVSEFIAPGSLRGYVTHPQLSEVIDDPKNAPRTVGEALGIGTLTVRRALSGDMQAYSGVSVMVSGEIGEDLAQYYVESEQIPTSVMVGVKLDSQGQVIAAGGILVQKMGSSEEVEELLADLEQRLSQIPSISTLIAESHDAKLIFQTVTANAEAQELDIRPVSFQCLCSRDRMALSLRTLDKTEIEQLYQEIGKLEVTCHYCRNSYQFSLDEIIGLH